MQRKIVTDDARMESESGKKTKVENGKSESGWGKAYHQGAQQVIVIPYEEWMSVSQKDL